MTTADPRPADPRPAEGPAAEGPAAGLPVLGPRVVLTAVGHLLAPVVVAAGLAVWAGTPQPGWIGLGAAGWLVALGLRAPLGAFLSRRAGGAISPSSGAALLMGLSSGPFEEGVRLALVLLLPVGTERAVWMGVGWAAVEAVNTAIGVVVGPILLARDDEKARQAREALAAQGTLDASPAWGVLERVSASALHVGLMVVVAWAPALAAVTAVAHSGVNYAAVRLARRSVARAEAAVAVAGVLALTVGIVLATG